jgi:serine/threonine protein kinase
VVHRDIKPANLIVQIGSDRSLRVRLMDFGVSKTATTDAFNPVITHQGTIVGTPHYMGPEQLVGGAADARADLYATGTMLYEMLAHRAPFEGDSVAEVVTAVLRRDFPPLSSLWPDIPPALDAVVTRAMAARPEDRFESARAMREALHAALVVPEDEEVSPRLVARAPTGALRPRLTARRSVAAVGVMTALTLLAWPRIVEDHAAAHSEVQVADPSPAQRAALKPLIEERPQASEKVQPLPLEQNSQGSARLERHARASRHGHRVRTRDSSARAEPTTVLPDAPVALPPNPY